MAHARRSVTKPLNALGYLRRRRIVGASLAAIAARRALAAAPWPTRPVRIVVGMPPGGAQDQMARGLAPHFAAAFGQPFYVEDKPGAGGTIAAAAVAEARDGHTLGLVLGGPTTTARALNPGIGYNPATAFSSITLLTRVPFVLVVNPALPVRDFAGLVAYARANPGALSYASIGPGTVTHLAMEDVKARLGIDLLHVPYRGFPQATLDLVAGQVQLMFNVPSAALEHLRAGTLRALAQTGETRMALLPNVPTLAEAGLPDTEFFGWSGLVAPAGFPPDAASRLAGVAHDALASDAAARAGLDQSGNELLGTDPWELAVLQAREAARWNALIERLGLQHKG